ncbi:MAG TPA: holo-ACP synthase [Pseudoclavibacter sp.]|nr:holo-ACP synthase [Pseudoclavibacter sp.]
MIIGIGLDVVNIERFGRHMENPRLRARLLLPTEDTGTMEHRAAIFAAKEAIVKAFGGVRSSEFRWHDIGISHGRDGRPVAILEGAVRQLASDRGVHRIHVTLSHDEPVAAAVVILEGRAS